MSAIEITNLTKTYENGVRALDGLSFDVPSGSVFGFLGLNGAGKSTTLRILAGLMRADSGVVRLFGSDIRLHGDMVRRRLGFVLDLPLYFDWLSAEEYLTFAGTMYGLTRADVKARAEELLAFFGLEAQVEQPIAMLSTGTRKKVALAAALLHAPEVLVLDEPFDGIDPLVAAAIKETLGMVARRGTTVLITSHVLETIESLCTHIGIIHHGRLLLQCAAAEIGTLAQSLTAGTREQGLEELFVRLVSDSTPRAPLSFL